MDDKYLLSLSTVCMIFDENINFIDFVSNLRYLLVTVELNMQIITKTDHRQARVLVPSMFIAQEPQMPSLHDLLKVSVGSSSFLILIRASKTIGPHLKIVNELKGLSDIV